MKAISSASNAAFRSWLRLATQPRTARRERRALAEGLHLAQAALDARVPIEAVLLRGGDRSEQADRLAAAALGGGADGYELAAQLYDRLAPVEHGAGLTVVVSVPMHPPPCAATHDLLFLDGLQDPGNVGTVLRTAAAAGIAEVLASPATAALWAPKTLRAGQGAHFRLRLHEGIDAAGLPQRLAGPWIGATAHGGAPLWQAALPPGALGWIFGAEGAGLSAAALAACTQRVSIPLDRAAESLNVAAAAAICLFERRRRLCASP